MSKVMRSVKNVTKGYSSVQVKVRNATSNDPWGPTGTDMSEIAQMTFNNSNDFYEIMDMLDKRLNDKGKNWRHVLKALKVLDYALHEGSELVVTWARKNIYIIKTLREFQYIDEDSKDVGLNVRTSAKELTSLILDEERLRMERSDRKSWKTRVAGLEEFAPTSAAYLGSDGGDSRQKPRRRERRGGGGDEEDAEYRLAIEASKYEAEEEKKRRGRSKEPMDDDDLAKAIKLSKEEEELRRRELEESNAAAIFSDAPAASQPTGFNQGYQQGGAVDWDGNINDNQARQQQPVNTGFLNNAYAQPTGYQPQRTGYQNPQNGFQNGFQPGVFDQQQYQQPQQNYMQPQTAAFGSTNNPYAQNQYDLSAQNQQQQQQQQQPQQQGNFVQAGSNNPYASQQGADELKPMPTGSNNPFASSFNRPPPQHDNTAPSLDTLQEQKVQTQFNNHNFNPPTSFSPQHTNPPPREQDPHHARLNALLASGEGLDTFGNTGDLRIPAHHTAPGTFVNSSGQGMTKLGPNQTGSNPFFQQQATGAPTQQPSSTGFGGSPSPFGSQPPQQQQQMPAQTGPANFGLGGPFGGGTGSSNNQYGRSQMPHQQTQGGSLIDL